jgi:hypothetical protein
MRKRIITPVKQGNVCPHVDWLNLDELADVEISSEQTAHPIESALLLDQVSGWRAAEPGKQTIRLIFTQPQALRRIWLNFLENHKERTQEYILQWSGDEGLSFQEIVRQRWNFNLHDASREIEDHQVQLSAVNVLELIIIPDINDQTAIACLQELRLA